MPDPRETAPKERIIFTAEADANHIEKNLRLTEEQLKQPKNAALYLSSVTAVYDAQAEPTGNACTVTVRVRLLTLLPQISV